MEIEHISIRNNNCSGLTFENKSYQYLLEIHTKAVINNLDKKAFLFIWNKLLSCRKRRTELTHNVIRVYLKKGDTIQKYIDNVSNVICQVNDYFELIEPVKTSRPKKNPVLKRIPPTKYYVQKHNSGIRPKELKLNERKGFGGL